MVDWDAVKIPEGSIAAGSAHVWDVGISVSDFESASVSSELQTAVEELVNRCAEEISGWLL